MQDVVMPKICSVRQHVIDLRSQGVLPQRGMPASLNVACPPSTTTPLPLPEELPPVEEGFPDDEEDVVLLLLDPVLLLLVPPWLLLPLLPLVMSFRLDA